MGSVTPQWGRRGSQAPAWTQRDCAGALPELTRRGRALAQACHRAVLRRGEHT